jgi:hypothetical protein
MKNENTESHTQMSHPFLSEENGEHLPGDE